MYQRSRGSRANPALPLVVLVAMVVAACSTPAAEPTSTTTTTTAPGDTTITAPEATPVPEEPVKVSMALPGPINDQGFNQAGYTGLQLIESLGAQISYVEQVGAAAQIETLQNLASESPDLVIAHGGQFTDAAIQVAEQFPNVNFSVFNGTKTAPNVNNYFIRYGQGSFIAGALAAMLSETGIVGFVGGAEIPPTLGATAGFEAGAKFINPDITVVSAIVGDFNDAPKAKEAALAHIASGVDVIYAFVDAGLPGVVGAIGESDVTVHLIGYIVPHCDSGEVFIADAIFDSVSMYRQIGESVFDGSWIGNTQTFVGLENPEVVRLTLCENRVDPAIAAEIEELTRKVVDGEVELPDGI